MQQNFAQNLQNDSKNIVDQFIEGEQRSCGN